MINFCVPLGEEKSCLLRKERKEERRPERKTFPRFRTASKNRYYIKKAEKHKGREKCLMWNSVGVGKKAKGCSHILSETNQNICGLLKNVPQRLQKTSF